jgi:hypothetical protein
MLNPYKFQEASNFYYFISDSPSSFRLLYNFLKINTMKKIMMMVVLATAVCFTVNAQRLDASKVPQAVKNSFSKKYPGTSATWEKEGSKYEAGFKQKGSTMSALFEANGTMTESEMDMAANQLPANVLSYVKTHYPGKKVKEGAKITKADGTVMYEAEVNGKDVIFDASGNYLKVVKD